MPIGDGIRRNVAEVSKEERDRLRDAFLQIDATKAYPDGVSYWDKQEQIHKNAHAAGADVHGGPAFLPWHRELCYRLEALLRQVDSQLSLHYWDWTTDPRDTADGAGGKVNLFSSQFMGSANGDAGPPLQDFESTEKAELGIPHDHVWRDVNMGNPGAPAVDSDQSIVTAGDSFPNQLQFQTFRKALETSHNISHGYIGGTIAHQHYSFHDPFVFLLHSNVDRIWAMWQTVPGEQWRLNPGLVYGLDGTAPSITENLEPWAGSAPPLLRPWAPPDNQQLKKNSKDPSVVAPPRYA